MINEFANLLCQRPVSKNSLNVREETEHQPKQREFPAELPGPEYKRELVWRNIIIFLLLHIGAIYGILQPKKHWVTYLFCK